MPDTPDDHTSSIPQLVEDARALFMTQLRSRESHTIGSEHPALLGAFDNAISELTAKLWGAQMARVHETRVKFDHSTPAAVGDHTVTYSHADLAWKPIRVDGSYVLVEVNVNGFQKVEGWTIAMVAQHVDALRTELATARGELALGKRLALKQRQAFSTHDPVCGRCIALAAAAGSDLPLKTAHAGDTCSRCGAVVVARKPGETDAEFRARLRGTS